MNSSAASCGESGRLAHSSGTGSSGSSPEAAPTCRSLYTTRPQYGGGMSGVLVTLVGVLNEKYWVAPAASDPGAETIQVCDGVLLALTSALWRASWMGSLSLVSAPTLPSHCFSACPLGKAAPFGSVVTMSPSMLPMSLEPVLQVARFSLP